MSVTVVRRGGAAAIAVLLASLFSFSSASAAGAQGAVEQVPSWAHKAKAASRPDPAQKLDVTVALRLRNQADLEALARAVSTPGSPVRGKYISAAQFRDRFAPTAQAVSAVSQYLGAVGLHVESVPSNHLYVEATGTVASVESAFRTQLVNYLVNGATRRAPAQTATLPSGLAAYVDGVSGLASATEMTPSAISDGVDAPPQPVYVNAPPCSTYWGQMMATTLPTAYGVVQPYTPCGYTPAQLRGAYGVDRLVASGLDGRGATVAIVDAFASPTILADANQYSTNRGEPTFQPGQAAQIVPPGIFNVPASDKCGPQGWYGEETLDVEAVHGIAPGANVLYVGGKSCEDKDLLDALNIVVNGQLANVITNSWGGTGDVDQLSAGIAAEYSHVFLQAVVEGIGMQFSSGDNGDEVLDAGVRTVDFPASDPWVTGVGGTSLAVGAKNNYLFEAGWGTEKTSLVSGAWSPAPPGTTFLYGSGGGTSQIFSQPFYQVGIVPAAVSGYFGGRGRAVPDVAMVGDPQTGLLIGQTQTYPDGTVKYEEHRVGGTSLASPLFAGIMAISDEAADFSIGFANPNIYGLAGTKALRDVVAPSSPVAVVRNSYVNSTDASGGISTTLRTTNEDGTLTVTAGYDDVTGLGSPNGLDFVSTVGFI